MADTQNAASEAGRALARARWGTTVLSQAVRTVVERRADLDDSQRGALDEALKAELRETADTAVRPVPAGGEV